MGQFEPMRGGGPAVSGDKKADPRGSAEMDQRRKAFGTSYLISLWSVWRLRKGLYFFFSMRSVTVFLFRFVR